MHERRQRASRGSGALKLRDACVPGVPKRWGVALAAMFRAGSHGNKQDILHEMREVERERLPITATPEQIATAAQQAARECYALCDRARTVDAIIGGIRAICERHAVNFPAGDIKREIITRALDELWWTRQLRKEVARRFEHTAIKLGFTGLKTGPYISHESAVQQVRRNQQNARLLESIELQNEFGQKYLMSELADLGTANKAIRLGELMTRMRGFEEIAFDSGHVSMFWTITCPSKYHSVGGTNEKYNGATPREAQAYLVGVWARIRSALKRKGIQCYGIRIAEPHTDGCPHWHLLLFVAASRAAEMERIISAYALSEDSEEAGALKNRVILVRIEAGKGTASGYIIKYISKNVAGEGVGDHKTRDGYIIAPDLFDGIELTPSERVTCWAQRWGIRQFQQIGGAPIGTWRELRRIKAESVQNAPEVIKEAWRAVQKIESDDPAIAKQADFAAYVKVQGGPFVGRGACIQIAKKMQLVEGRYLTREEAKPCGVYHVSQQNAVYESVRYTWTITSGRGVAVAVPWTGVNNCTFSDWYDQAEKRLIDEKIKICSADFIAEWKERRNSGADLEIDHEGLKRWTSTNRNYRERR